MKSKLFICLLSILFLSVFLYSCGSSSNGIFEKRKHMKGWHFQKNSNPTKNSTQEKSKDKLDENKLIENSNLSIKQRKDEAQKETTKIRIGKKAEAVIAENVKQVQAIDIEQANSYFSSDDHQRSEESSNARVDYEHVVEENPKINSPMNIALKFIGFFYLLWLALIISGTLSFLIIYSIPIVGVVFLIASVYLCLVYFAYLVARLHRREDGKEVWTLKQAFLRVAIIYSVLAAVFLYYFLSEIF